MFFYRVVKTPAGKLRTSNGAWLMSTSKRHAHMLRIEAHIYALRVRAFHNHVSRFARKPLLYLQARSTSIERAGKLRKTAYRTI